MFWSSGKPYAVVVSGGEIGPDACHRDQLIDALKGSSLVVAADRGATVLYDNGILPGVLVGDFDSCEPHVVKNMALAGVKIVALKVNKDKTDTEVALDIAAECGYSQVVVFGALGGRRQEHAMANLMLMEPYAEKGVDIALVHGDTFVYPVHPVLTGGVRRVLGKPGDWVSLVPITSRVTGVFTEGLKFPLSNACLHRGSTFSVSNEIVKEEALVTIGVGFLLIFVTTRRFD